DSRDVPQHVVASADADRRTGSVPLEADQAVVDGDPQLCLPGRFIEVDLDALHDAQYFPRSRGTRVKASPSSVTSRQADRRSSRAVRNAPRTCDSRAASARKALKWRISARTAQSGSSPLCSIQGRPLPISFVWSRLRR